jgi:glutamyl-tRNA synthetase
MSKDQPSNSNVVTRFAPSPTGFLHIGGARTALFNWLYARHTGGRYVLRIEDTDRARSTDEAIAAILDGLSWLGLESDAKPVFQFARADRHREVVETLLQEGHAYRCYCKPEELAEMRAQAEAEGRSPVYDGRWRDRDPAEAPADIAPAIRLKTRREGETVIDDQVQGQVVFDNTNLDDLIILRSDGTPTYNLAVVVDDHDMGITHVIRGSDHLTNAARQTQIYLAMGWDAPVFAHVPLIHGPDGAKLSKRHGALGVEAYRAMGYLPQALCNYLVRLGWSHGDDEILTPEQMIEWFDFNGLGKSPARFDFAKLDDLNGRGSARRPADPRRLRTDRLGYVQGGAAEPEGAGEDTQ